MHAIYVIKNSTQCDTLANVLYATDLHFFQTFFVTFPTSENQQKDKAAIVKAVFC